jgi:hypothetical protein
MEAGFRGMQEGSSRELPSAAPAWRKAPQGPGDHATAIAVKPAGND